MKRLYRDEHLSGIRGVCLQFTCTEVHTYEKQVEPPRAFAEDKECPKTFFDNVTETNDLCGILLLFKDKNTNPKPKVTYQKVAHAMTCTDPKKMYYFTGMGFLNLVPHV